MMMRRKLVFYSVSALLCLGLAGPASAAGELVVNGGFETGDFTGWTMGGNFEFTGVSGNFDGFLPHSGNFFAFLGPVGADGTLSQDLVTTPGQTYTFSFAVGSDGATPNDFNASWNGSTILSLTDIPQTPGYPGAAYTVYSFTEVATGALTNITLGFRNDPSFLALDDVSVVAGVVPEPSSIVLSGIGVLTFAGYTIRRRRRATT
jgi:hypothetical protein